MSHNLNQEVIFDREYIKRGSHRHHHTKKEKLDKYEVAECDFFDREGITFNAIILPEIGRY